MDEGEVWRGGSIKGEKMGEDEVWRGGQSCYQESNSSVITITTNTHHIIYHTTSTDPNSYLQVIFKLLNTYLRTYRS